jgi:uncharacterized membrane protein YGL010W
MTSFVDQLRAYPRVHQSRLNLAIHVLAVPLFWAGLAAFAVAASNGPIFIVYGAGAVVASIALQGLGHRFEREAAEPFSGPLNFIYRLTKESLILFPVFALSGGFASVWNGRPRKT